MRLTTFSDYSIRVMMYLALSEGKLATISEIAKAYHISEHHLTKVVHHLAKHGYAETIRGKGGGLRLARDAAKINLGEMIRKSEGDAGFLPCMESKGYCCIQPACKLIGILHEAQDALFSVLDKYTLADLVSPGKPLAKILFRSKSLN